MLVRDDELLPESTDAQVLSARFDDLCAKPKLDLERQSEPEPVFPIANNILIPIPIPIPKK